MLRLKAHDEHRVLGFVDEAREVMDDPPAGGHAAGCDDHRRLSSIIERLGLLGAPAALKAIRVERAEMLLDQLLQVFVVLRCRLTVDVGGLDRHRAIEEDILGVELTVVGEL